MQFLITNIALNAVLSSMTLISMENIKRLALFDDVKPKTYISLAMHISLMIIPLTIKKTLLAILQ
mgnify:CR=1 FL=1